MAKKKKTTKKNPQKMQRKKPKGWVKASAVKFVRGGVLIRKPAPRRKRKK